MYSASKLYGWLWWAVCTSPCTRAATSHQKLTTEVRLSNADVVRFLISAWTLRNPSTHVRAEAPKEFESVVFQCFKSLDYYIGRMKNNRDKTMPELLG